MEIIKLYFNSILNMSQVVDVHKKELNKMGYADFTDWLNHENHAYIGRNMVFYVPGTFHSKWHSVVRRTTPVN